MRALAGLLSTTGGSGSTLRLHPLIEGYCERRRFEETPERLRAIHRGIAQALARRGRVVEALRHAAEGSDTTLLGRFAESTGGVRLWLEHGLEGLRTVNGLLTAEALSTNPRLALLRCVALTAADDIDGAKRLYGAAAEETAGFTRDRKGGDDPALQFDHIFVQCPLHMQHMDVVGAPEPITGDGRIRAVGEVAFAHGAHRFARSEPPRGRVLMKRSISSSGQPTARAPIRRGSGNLPIFIRA